MSDQDGYDAAAEHAKTLDVISRFCRAASALVDNKKMPLVHTAMLTLLTEIDDEIERAEVLHRVQSAAGMQ